MVGGDLVVVLVGLLCVGASPGPGACVGAGAGAGAGADVAGVVLPGPPAPAAGL
jgi:hypothetical protein